jgi:hypothetical protein
MRRFPCGQHKRPLVKDWPNVATEDPGQWGRWERRWPDLLWGVVTGDDFDVLDIDPRRGGEEWLASVVLPPTMRVSTRSGGVHIYFRHAAGVRNSADKIALGVDVRGEGGYVIAWHLHGYPGEGTPQPWPDWLLEELRSTGRESDCEPPGRANGTPIVVSDRYSEAALKSACERIAGAVNGKQEHVLNSESLSIGKLVAKGLIAGHEAERALVAAGMSMACHRVHEPWTHRCVTEKVRRGLRDGAR